jgi:hypothetical protein
MFLFVYKIIIHISVSTKHVMTIIVAINVLYLIGI